MALLDVEYQSLQVFALGMVDADRVVGRLGELVQDAHAAARHGGCREDGRAEVLLADCLRAGEGEQDTSGFDFLECLDVELAIAL